MAIQYIALILTSVTIVSAYGVEPRIIGGEPAFRDEFPFVVSLRFHYVHHCAGSIITNRHILTAAHCILNGTSDLSVYSAFVGSNKLTEGRHVEIESITVHEKYIGQQDWWKNDLAIIKLKDCLHFTDSMKRINVRRQPLKGNENVTAIGWGLVLQPASFLPNFQQKLIAKELPYEKCKQYWNNIAPNHLCFWNGETSGKGICMADSGGPLVHENELVGVLSWTPATCTDHKPDVAVRLAPEYIEWIDNNLI